MINNIKLSPEDEQIRRDFPLLCKYPEIAYLDSTATAQKLQRVLDAEKYFYENHNANPLRGLYDLSLRATEDYENAREVIREFINADSAEEIIFTRNATESLNLIAYCWEGFFKPGDEMIVTIMEHHSNLLPWRRIAERTGSILKYLECDPEGYITEENFKKLLSDRTKLVAMTRVSNVLGVENDIKTFAKLAHDAGAVFVCDGAQSAPHMKTDVKDLDIDFFAFSGHKMCGPMGIGVLYGRKELLNKMPPFLYGGEMIEYVTRDSATYAEPPHKFEAGTVNAAGAVGLAAAVKYYQEIGFDKIQEREKQLSKYAFDALKSVPRLKLLGPDNAEEHHGIFTFVIEGAHPHDIAEILNQDKINIRAGHHCAQPLMEFLGVSSTARASVFFYNNLSEITRLAESLSQARRKLGYLD